MEGFDSPGMCVRLVDQSVAQTNLFVCSRKSNRICEPSLLEKYARALRQVAFFHPSVQLDANTPKNIAQNFLPENNAAPKSCAQFNICNSTAEII